MKNKNYALSTLERLIEASKGAIDLEDRIKEGENLIEEKKDFKGSFAERYAKK